MALKQLALRMTPDEIERVRLAARNAGIGNSEFMRQTILEALSRDRQVEDRREARLAVMEEMLSEIAATSAAAVGFLAFHELPKLAGEVADTHLATRSNVELSLRLGKNVRKGIKAGVFGKDPS